MEKKAAVCVTGVTGYLGTEIAHQLLSKGYIVHGTVRSLDSEASKELQQLFPTLKLFEADLLKEGSFDKAVEGCTAVIHAASPFVLVVKDPQTELIDPALNGTKTVLDSVAKHGVKSVILTGSLAAVVEHTPTDDGSKVWTEEDWNTTSTLKEGPYRLSKVLAEKYSYEWNEKHPDVKVCTVLPTFIIGPPHIKRADATSIKFMRDTLNGTFKADGGAPAASSGMVDIRDVALAHILAFELPHTKGRYLVTSEEGIPRIEAARILKKEFPDYPIPEAQKGVLLYKAGNLLPHGRYSVAKAERELGIKFRPIPTALIEMAHKMIELGIIPKQQT